MVRNPGSSRQVLRRNIQFPKILMTGELFGDFEVLANGVANVLRPTTRKAPAGDTVARLGTNQRDGVPHIRQCNRPARWYYVE
jgi:hypothetical protein